MNVFDTSALLAFLQGESGADVVERELAAGEAVCGAANWAEVAQRFHAHGRDWSLGRTLLQSYALSVEPVTVQDAESAARQWSREGLSLGDRLCLALGDRLDADVWTADRRWGSDGRIQQIR